MKTQTRAQILKIIEEKGKIRPNELRELLNISAQAIHRHLRSLSEDGVIEALGSAPFTQYALAGTPDFEGVCNWIKAPSPINNPELVCETQPIFAARLPRLKTSLDDGLPVSLLPLVISTAGEIGNNSFDHNLGQWRDVPGCWFESQVTGKNLWVCIADRGQGIFHSLAKVHPQITNDQEALKAAFETIISGRAPEKRGNGLKFVRKTISDSSGGGLACMSGSGHVQYGEQGEKALALLKKNFTKVQGTITLMIWRIA